MSYRALKLANCKQGDTVLITGASGGVGVHAIQVAKSIGTNVICITSSEDKIQKLLDLGADKVILSNNGSFHREGEQIQLFFYILILNSIK